MSRWSKAIIIGLLTSLLGLGLLPFGHQLEENVGVDLLFRLRGAREAPSDVLIVSIDKVSAAHLNLPPEPAKWPRTLHAHLTEYLAEQGVDPLRMRYAGKGEEEPISSNATEAGRSKNRRVELIATE